jgi:hypothetical protein
MILSGFNRTHPKAVQRKLLAKRQVAKPVRTDEAIALGSALRTDERTIIVLANGNPKHGKAKARFALYRTGMTADEYKCAVGVQQGNLDLRWDSRKGFIKVE